MSEEAKPNPTRLEKASMAYSDAWYIRALMQAIPSAGGSLDVLLSELGTQFRQKRLETFINDFSLRLGGLEKKIEDQVSNHPEELFDLMRSLLQGSDETRDDEKRKLFANILLNQIERENTFEESEIVTRLLRQCSDAHIQILKAACAAPAVADPWGQKRVSAIGVNASQGPADPKMNDLVEIFPQVPASRLKLFVSELVFMGLLTDEGSGRYGTVSMSYFTPSDLADLFLDWITRS